MLDFLKRLAASVATPSPGRVKLYMNSTDGTPHIKDETGLDQSLVGTPSSRQVIAGAGLTGGGALTSDVTLDAAANADGSIVVNANDIQVGVLATDAQHGVRGGGTQHAAATVTAAGFMSSLDKVKMGQAVDAQADLGFVGDLITTNSTSSCNTAAPSKILDSANPFTSYYVGKRITLSGAGAAGAQYVGTIVAVDSAGQVDVTPNISTTVATKIASFGTDNATATTALQTLVNTTNAAFPGTKIIFGKSLTNAYGFTTPVIFNKQVTLEGIGGWWNADNGDYTRIGGTRLAWWGTTSDGGVDFGAFFTIQPGAGATQALKSPAIRDIWFDGRNGDQQAALYGIRWAGCHAAQMENVGFIDFRGAGYICNSTAVSLSPASDQGTLRPVFKNINVRNLETFVGAITTPITTSSAITLTNTGQNITVSAATMPVDASSTSYAWIQSTAGPRILVKYTGGGTTTLNVKCSVEDVVHAYATIANCNVVSATPQNAACAVFDGNATSNTNCGIIIQQQFSHGAVYGPAALDIRNADSMEFVSQYVNGGSPTAETNPLINRTRKEGITLAGSIPADSLCARNNTFRGGDPSSSSAAGITAFGLAAAGTMLPFPARGNYWDLMQLGNGARIPICETLTASNTQGAAGAYLDWTGNGALRRGALGRTSVADQACTASVANVVTGGLISLPSAAFQVGLTIRWVVNLSKTAAGLAARVWNVRYTTNGANTGGTVIATISRASTAAIDRGQVVIEMTVRTLGAAATAVAEYHVRKSLATAAGLDSGVASSTISVAMTMAAFDSVAPFTGVRYLHLEATPGASEVLTISQARVECSHAGNP